MAHEKLSVSKALPVLIFVIVGDELTMPPKINFLYGLIYGTLLMYADAILNP